MKQNICYLFLGTLIFLSACGNNSSQQSAHKLLHRAPGLVANVVNFDPDFEKEFVASFQMSSTPYTVDTSYALQDTIPAEVVIKYILEAAKAADLEAFGDVWGDAETEEMTRKGLKDRYINVEKNAFAVINFGQGTRLRLSPDYHSFVFHYIPTFMDGRYKYTFLANYTDEGKLIDVLPIGELTQFVDMENIQTATIDEEGNVQVKTKLIRYGQMYDQAKDYEETGEQTFTIDSTGKFILKQEQYSSFSGKFLAQTDSDLTAPRFLIEQIFEDTQVRYQASADTYPQEWEIIEINADENELIARKPGTMQDYTLSYDKEKATFVCKNEKGEKMNYTRIRK